LSFRSRNRPPRPESGGVDDWLMSYADMITLLLCFFALFLSVSVPEKEKFEEAKRELREEFSAPEDVLDRDILQGKFPPSREQPQSDVLYKALPSIVDRYEGGEDLGEKIQVEREGDRITIINLDSAPLFPQGSADLSEGGRAALASILGILTAPDKKEFQITVEGHTDDAPIATMRFPSNWELSTARAGSVVRFLLEKGIPASRLRAAGYADSQPKVSNRDEKGAPIPANQAQNRRVVIRLEKIEKAE